MKRQLMRLDELAIRQNWAKMWADAGLDELTRIRD